ncbi:MAG: hypothetical protein LIP12_09575 [Clostridiales bacterium]|nr:hypothetical protein [Clostridiales bacterium]
MNEITINPQDVIRFAIGDIYEIGGHRYRIFFVSRFTVGTVRMDCHKCENFTPEALMKGVKDGSYKKTEAPPDPPGVCLSGDIQKKAYARSLVINEFILDISPAWTKIGRQGVYIPGIHAAADKLGLSKKQFLRLFFKYLQSGCDMASLVDNRSTKLARKVSHPALTGQELLSKEDEAMEYGVAVFKEKLNVKAAHRYMLLNYYTSSEMVEEGSALVEKYHVSDDAPDYQKFYRRVAKSLGDKTVTQYIKGTREVRNNERFLFGNQQTGIIAPGQTVQVDECEVGVQLIAPNGDVIGKPVLYCAFDPKANIIIGVYIGYENNSVSGFVNLMMSMMEPHEKQTSLVGVHCSDYSFPSMVVPRQVYTDQGSEYMSKHMARIMEEWHIELYPVPAATGSYKGGVENVFRRLQRHLKSLLIRDGYIMETHEGPKEARENAILLLDDYKQMCYRLILQLNTTQLGEGYERPVELNDSDIPSVPAEIWRFYTNQLLEPVRITDANRATLLYALLWDDKSFKRGRAGLSYKFLTYACEEDWFTELLKAKNPEYEIRYADTDISRIYVKYKGKLHAVPLSRSKDQLRGYAGKTWKQIDAYGQGEKERRKERDKVDQDIVITTLAQNEQTLNAAKALSNDTPNNTKGIALARAAEKERLSQDDDEVKRRVLDDAFPVDALISEGVTTPDLSPGIMDDDDDDDDWVFGDDRKR